MLVLLLRLGLSLGLRLRLGLAQALLVVPQAMGRLQTKRDERSFGNPFSYSH